MTQPVDPTLAARQDIEVLMQRGPIVGAEVGRLLGAYRAAVLCEAADAIDTTYTGFGIDRYVRHGADLLRRMAEGARS